MVRMSAHFQLARDEHKPLQVLVKADKEVPYEKVVDLMSVLQKSGAEQVGLLTAPIETDTDGALA
jgi:biopolymer transport protein ExbD